MTELMLMPVILCFLRVAAFVAFLPPLGGQHVPNLVKIGLVLALTAFWSPRAIQPSINPRSTAKTPSEIRSGNVQSADRVAGPVSIPLQESLRMTSAQSRREPLQQGAAAATTGVLLSNSAGSSHRWLLWIWLAVREILLGATLGWLLGMILVPLKIAGSWLAEQIGLDIASIAAGTETGSGNVLAVILESCGVLLLYTLNVHHDFLRIFDRSFDQHHVGQAWTAPETGWVIGALTRMPERGLMIAAPTGVLFILIMLVLLFAMKQSPQFNLFTFGMPFRLAAGLIALVVMFPDMLANVTLHLQGFLQNPH